LFSIDKFGIERDVIGGTGKDDELEDTFDKFNGAATNSVENFDIDSDDEGDKFIGFESNTISFACDGDEETDSCTFEVLDDDGIDDGDNDVKSVSVELDDEDETDDETDENAIDDGDGHGTDDEIEEDFETDEDNDAETD